MSSTFAFAFCFIFAISALFFASHARRNCRRLLNLPSGPKGLPFIGSALEINSSEPWITFTHWGSSYGHLVYCTLFGRRVLVIQTTSVAKELLERRSGIYSGRPPVTVHKEVGSEFNTALLQYGEEWRLHRRLFHQSFCADATRDYSPIHLRKVRGLLMGILGSPEHYQRKIELYASAVIMAAVYDYDTVPDGDPVVLAAEKAIRGFLRVAGPLTAVVLEAFPFLLKVPAWFPGATLKCVAMQAKSDGRVMVDVPFSYARDRTVSCISRPCMISESLKHFQGVNSESFELALKSSSATAFIAGVETTASTLIIFVLAMMCYPEVQGRAQREIDAVIGTHRLPNFEDRSSLPYVDAVLRETLRWHPVFPLGLPHYTIRNDSYEGYDIPQGCVVLANIWAMSRDEVKYPNPNEFVPERFLSQDGGLNDDSVAFAFGFGRRVCAGRHFADASLWIAIVHLLATFKFMKQVGEDGVELNPTPEWSTGLVSRPLNLKCRVVPRFPGVCADELMSMIRSSD